MTWQPIAHVNEAPQDDEEAVPISVGDTHLALIRLDGVLHAVNNVCTHQFAFLSDGIVEDGCIECPLHQARFDVLTGRHAGGPACADLAVYPVKIEGDHVLVDIGSPPHTQP